MKPLVGRKYEVGILQNALKSSRPELIVVYGRRRVGKTFLVRSVYKNAIQFEFSGINKIPLQKQLLNFHLTLSAKGQNCKKPNSWIEAFFLLGQYIATLKSKKKKVIFIDEFPWLDSRKSDFLPAFDNFWNSFVSKRSDLVIVICGSAASYMIQKIIKNKGGLHNRLTQKIKLKPFDLHDTELLLKRNGVKLSRYDITQIYMAMGGVPHYLEMILPGESVAQTIDRLCFQKDGFLRTEFDNVFASLFNHHHNHEAIIRALASMRKGLTRTEIFNKSKIKTGGTLSRNLEELEESGFVEKYTPYRGTKDSMYRLSDEYSMFYYKFIHKSKTADSQTWIKLSGQQSYKIWSGYTFETVCLKHLPQIKEGLKISGIHSTHGSWIQKKSNNNAQIDLLIDRDDNIINLCEMKFYNSKFVLTKKYASELINKANSFSALTKTKKNIFITFITTYGLEENQHSIQVVQNQLTINHLFASV